MTAIPDAMRVNRGGRKYTLEEVGYPGAKVRRDAMRALKICINSSYRMKPSSLPPPATEHGPPVKGGRCQRCCEIHAKSRGGYASKFSEVAG